jgi:chemotaxis protein CheC
MLTDLSDLERDALTELVNIAVSGAASRLATMVASEVSLTVPIVSVLQAEDAGMTLSGLGLGKVISVRQAFNGRLNGKTILLFPEGDEDVLVRAILGASMPDDEFHDIATDALGELGNVLLLGFLASIGSMLSLTFDVSLPHVMITDPDHILSPDEGAVILFIYVNFNIRGTHARGYFSLVLGLGGFTALREILAAFVANLIE